ncbi:hypothetical protein WJX77_001787 [Trebouxia sp. C0004]
MVVDRVWDDDMFEEPLEVRKQRKSLTSHPAVVTPAAATQGPTHAARGSNIQRFKELQHCVERAEAELETCVQVLSVLTTRAEQGNQLAANMQAEMAKLQQEQVQLQAQRPIPVERLQLVETSLTDCSAALANQLGLLTNTQQSIRHAELAVRQAENGVLDAAPAQLELQGLTGRLAAQQQQLASTRHTQEMQGALAHSKQLTRQQSLQAGAVAAAEASGQAAIAAATAGRKAAAARMKQKTAQLSPTKEGVNLVQAQQRDRQQRAAVDLKHHIDEVQAGLADKAEVHQTRAKQQADMHAEEFNALLESRQNPYAVFRQQTESVKIAQQQQRHAAKVKAKEAVINSQLQAEKQAHQRAVAARKAVQQVEAQFAKEMGAEAREKRIDRFMRSHTVGHQSILDPTGNLPVYPSQATLVKDWSFGMGTGTVSAELIAKYQELNPDVEPSQILLPRRLRQLDPVAPTGALPHTSQDTASIAGGAPVASQARLASSLGPAVASPGLNAPDPDALGQEAGGLYQPKLSKHEKQLMQQAHERHKANITTKQVVMGREFEGEAFMPTPAVVLFKDFEVGQTYRRVITLTNTSLARNAFKVLELPADICDTVELQYKPPGHISAGLTCQITIMFTPKVNEDIQSNIPLLSQTGPIGIPVSCLIKRAVLSVMPQELSVGPPGGVVLGEQGQAAFTILNEGALQVQFEISSGGQDMPALPAGSGGKRADGGTSERDGQLQLGSLVVVCKQGVVQGYSKTQVKVAFTPAVQGPVKEQISLAFRALKDKRVTLPPAIVTLTGIGRAVPVYTDSELIDFKCCFMGQVYRHAMRIHNRGSSAMKATLSLPPSVHPFLQAQPTTGFCQTGDSFEFALRLCGHASIWEACSKFVVDNEAGILQLPAKVTVAGQVLPVLACIRLQLTSTRISFQPSHLDFGECNLMEKTGVTVQVTNHSTLPQKYGFGRLPKGVSISPGDGYGMLLPLETICLTPSFMPSLTGPYNFQLECQTPLNTKFSLPCTAMARLPAITLSHNHIQLPATAIHDIATASVILRNTTPDPQTFEFSVPQGSDMTLSPHVDTIQGGGSLRVMLRYCPQPSTAPAVPAESDLQSADATPEGTAGSSGAGAANAAGTDEAQQEAWSRCCHWHIPCYLKPRLAPPQPPSPVTPAQGISRQPQSPSRRNLSTSRQSQLQQPQQLLPADTVGNQVAVPQVIHLDVSTCAVLPDLALEGEGASWQPDRGLWEVDFGSSAVGQRAVKQLRVTSSSPSALPLFADLLSPQRTFTVVNAVRPMAPQGQSTILLDFTPPECQAFEEVLTVRCPKSRLRIKLKGEGISPAIKVMPEDVTAKGMDMGDVLKGEAAEKVITITNTGTFTSSYRVVVVPADSSAHPAPFTKQAPFTCAPQEGTLAPGASQKIIVSFLPEVAFPYYAAKVQLTVPGMQEVCWTMQGRGWDEGGVIVGPDYPTPLTNPFRTPALVPAVASKGAQPATGAAPPFTAADANPDLQLSVAMPRSVSPGESVSVTLEVVSLKSRAGGSPVEFTLDPIPASVSAAGFKVDSLKLAVPAGERKSLTITFSAPQQPKAGSPAALGLSEEVIGTLMGVLKGGVPPPKAAAGRRILLSLKCQLCRQ